MDAAAVVDNDVAKVDPDSKFNSGLAGHLSIPRNHSALDLNSATQCVDDARKQDEQAITGGPYDPASVFTDLGTNECIVMGFHLSERALVVGADQPAVADDISRKNGGHTSFDTLWLQGSLHNGAKKVRSARRNTKHGIRSYAIGLLEKTTQVSPARGNFSSWADAVERATKAWQLRRARSFAVKASFRMTF